MFLTLFFDVFGKSMIDSQIGPNYLAFIPLYPKIVKDENVFLHLYC